jgi:hypothetical protein
MINRLSIDHGRLNTKAAGVELYRLGFLSSGSRLYYYFKSYVILTPAVAVLLFVSETDQPAGT